MNTDELRTALLACEGGLAEAPLAKALAEGDFDVVTISDPDGMPLEQAVRIAAAPAEGWRGLRSSPCAT